MNQQRGVITILLTSVLLVVILLLVLGSYRITFHQLKVAQNEVRSRSQHWMAEGAIECLFAYINATGIAPAQLTQNSTMASFDTMRTLCVDNASEQALFTEPVASHYYRVVFEVDDVRLVSKTMVKTIHQGHTSYRWLKGSWSDW
ncbi:hypothetical protein VII00023_14261 [Vibrio ichthyoenteri ATCC 700023]|uniref:MSHA biogenesis protein MshP n=1 Tax=Vibrio ichthyoenteri ATCC 700023 TaxID=870968 RepID=F9S2A2_9VIBR|nr:hypothetical protein [Vibrio ichthyoenteri]EGU39892.1 hypothetical protein VII00023_14261 [Vibrio ichthyoenteri ATCC 700023]